MRSRIAAVAALLLVLWLPPAGQARQAAAPDGTRRLPPLVDAYVRRSVKLTDAQMGALLSGAPVTKLLDADPATEVSVFGAVWVEAPPALYVEAVRDIENFERGGAFRITKRIGTPPRLEDFAQLTLTQDDMEDLRACKIGACEVKLSQESLERLRKEIDWSKPTAREDVDALTRRIALEFVTGYLEGGNERLAVYRDGGRPTFVAQEFTSMVDRLPALVEHLPELKRYLLEFPGAVLDGSTSFLYWQEAQFGLKPTIRISHVVILERPDHVVVASKLLYATHYFWTALEIRVLVPEPSRGTGFWFVNVNRSRSDGLSGFVGRMIRGKVRGEAQKGLEAALKGTKATLEQRARPKA
jgi:hypothetical protein